ncbi:MAG: response regulator, partial [Pseudomonadota bacterium]
MAERHALLIESNPALARTYSGYLRDTAWRVTAVGTVADAVALLRERRPSVIVLDLRTPDMAGFEAIAAIQGVAAGTPLIAIASEGSVGVAVDVMRRGAQDFLVKPFSETRFCAALDDAFAANETESAAAP